MLNKVVLIGHLSRDPEIKHTNTGKAVANFTVAVNRGFGKDQEADFIPVVAWNNTAEAVSNYLVKGSLVAVEGRMQVRSYEAKDGGRRWVTEVIANSVLFLDKRAGSAEGSRDDGEPDIDDGKMEVPF